MWWHYLYVFLGSMLVDIVPIPLPPAFTVMVSLQIIFHLNIWAVIFAGVTGSILGRYILILYVARLSDKVLKPAKNADMQYLGAQMHKKKWKGMMGVLLYSLLPLPTTPLFIMSGLARLRPVFVILPFIVGKTLSDTAAVLAGRYAAENTAHLLSGFVSWKSVTGLVLGLLLIFLLLFVDWRTLLQSKKLAFRFDIFGRGNGSQAE